MNPARQRKISVAFPVDDADVSHSVTAAMSSARSAQSRWLPVSLKRRLHCIRHLRQLIAENAGELAEASSFARLRPMAESLTAEVLPLAEACRFLERRAQKILAPQRLGALSRPLWLGRVNSEILREPFGVVLIIGPGNYPLLLPGVQVVQALAAGNAVLLKPGAGGAAAATALRDLIVRAEFPPELISVLPESTDAARAAIAARPDKVVFTGSAATGELIQAQLAPQLIPATMELSGCDAVIVRADADPGLTVKALAFGLRLNDGATCLSPKGVFVHRSIATELEGRLASAIKPERVLDTAATARLLPLLNDAVAHGAHFVAGGVQNDGSIRVPLVLAGVSPHARLLVNDVFLPALALVTVADDHDALLRVNDCPFALGASVFSRDETAARALALRIQSGVVTINDLIIPTADARLPFGGCRRSGFGATRGAEGLLEMTRPKVVTRTRGTFRPAFEPPKTGDAEMFQAYLRLTHGRGMAVRFRALVTFVRNLAGRRNNSITENS